MGLLERNVNFDTMLPCVTFWRLVTFLIKLYPEKWTQILQPPMYVDSETAQWTRKVPSIPMVQTKKLHYGKEKGVQTPAGWYRIIIWEELL